MIFNSAFNADSYSLSLGVKQHQQTIAACWSHNLCTAPVPHRSMLRPRHCLFQDWKITFNLCVIGLQYFLCICSSSIACKFSVQTKRDESEKHLAHYCNVVNYGNMRISYN